MNWHFFSGWTFRRALGVWVLAAALIEMSADHAGPDADADIKAKAITIAGTLCIAPTQANSPKRNVNAAYDEKCIF